MIRLHPGVDITDIAGLLIWRCQLHETPLLVSSELPASNSTNLRRWKDSTKTETIATRYRPIQPQLVPQSGRIVAGATTADKMGEPVATTQEMPQLRITKIQDSSDIEKHIPSLRCLLQACVNDEPAVSSIGFLHPLSDQNATDYWLRLFPSVIGPNSPTMLLIATYPGAADSSVVATVQIARMTKETNNYRGEIRKLLVHPAYRRSGVGRQVIGEVERIARDELGLEMLMLNTPTGTPARDFYLRLGWHEWGICPVYVKYADGRKGDCRFFLKMLQ